MTQLMYPKTVSDPVNMGTVSEIIYAQDELDLDSPLSLGDMYELGQEGCEKYLTELLNTIDALEAERI